MRILGVHALWWRKVGSKPTAADPLTSLVHVVDGPPRSTGSIAFAHSSRQKVKVTPGSARSGSIKSTLGEQPGMWRRVKLRGNQLKLRSSFTFVSLGAGVKEEIEEKRERERENIRDVCCKWSHGYNGSKPRCYLNYFPSRYNFLPFFAPDCFPHRYSSDQPDYFTVAISYVMKLHTLWRTPF